MTITLANPLSASVIEDGSGTLLNGVWPMSWPVILKSAVISVSSGAGNVVGTTSNFTGRVNRRFVPT